MGFSDLGNVWFETSLCRVNGLVGLGRFRVARFLFCHVRGCLMSEENTEVAESESVEGLPGNYAETAIEAEVNRCIAELDDGFKSVQRKSGAIVLGSSTMVSVFTALSVFTSGGEVGKWIGFLSVLVFAITLSWMLWHGTKIWGPSGIAVFDATDANSLYDRYLNQTPGYCYSQLMVDKCSMVRENIKVNRDLSKQLSWMIFVFQIQVGLIGVLAIVGAVLKIVWG